MNSKHSPNLPLDYTFKLSKKGESLKELYFSVTETHCWVHHLLFWADKSHLSCQINCTVLLN